MSNSTSIPDDNEEVGMGIRAVESSIIAVIIVCSIVGNVSLWIIVLRSSALRTVTNMFILGLSMADLLVATVNMPITMYTLIVGGWTLPYAACQLTGFTNMLTLVTSVLSLCNISINRYFMVVLPSKFKNIYTPVKATLMIIAVVSLSVLLSSFPLYGWCSYEFIPVQSFCFADWKNSKSYAFFMISCCFCVPLSVMTVCNICIFRTVRESTRKVKIVATRSNDPGINSSSRSRDLAFDSVSSSSGAFGNDYIDKKKLKKSKNKKNRTFKEKTGSCIHCPEGLFSVEQDNKRLREENSICTNTETMTNEPLAEDRRTAVVNGAVEAESTDEMLEERPPKLSRSISYRTSYRKAVDKSEGLSETNIDTKPVKPDIDRSMLHPTWRTSEETKNACPEVLDDVGTSDMSISSSVIKRVTSVSGSDAAGGIKDRLSRTKSPPIRRREEIRLARSLAIIVVIFVLCWLPYCVSMIILIFLPEGQVPRSFHVFTLLIGYANSMCNPIVYGIMNKRFKIGFKRLFCYCKYK